MLPAEDGEEIDVRYLRGASLAVACAASMAATEAPAQTPEEFYRGKTIDFVIGYPPGGSNDVWGRLIARHLGRHVPGKPNVVPKNMPGAGSFLAVNQIFNVLPKDGILDPQGRAVEQSLAHLELPGVEGVSGVRVGRRIELTVEASDEGAARAVVDGLARELFANPLIEQAAVEVVAAASSTVGAPP